MGIRVVFDKKFDEFNGFVEECENYKDGPEAYEKDLKAFGEMLIKYKREHPGATGEDASVAFNAAWK